MERFFIPFIQFFKKAWLDQVEIVVNPAMTDGQHSAAVKAQIDKMLSYRAAIEENRAGLQEDMMRRYDRRYLQLKGMEQGALVMVEAKHIMGIPTNMRC